MRIRSWKAAVLALALALLVGTGMLATQSLDAGAASRGASAAVARGQYLTTIMDCAGCHTPGALAGQPDFDRHLAGSAIGFALPGGGVVYPKNLTPDVETGLGRWSEDDIARAVRQGQSRDGRVLIPVMPWPSYAVLTEADARAIAAYLKTVPAVRFSVPRDVRAGETPAAPYVTVVTP
ncbi:MAG TPA: cytochrome c [Verrucomicrobiae bacterium]|nr:cytochrome c [Verrucomicrobiae bacterium]